MLPIALRQHTIVSPVPSTLLALVFTRCSSHVHPVPTLLVNKFISSHSRSSHPHPRPHPHPHPSIHPFIHSSIHQDPSLSDHHSSLYRTISHPNPPPSRSIRQNPLPPSLPDGHLHSFSFRTSIGYSLNPSE